MSLVLALWGCAEGAESSSLLVSSKGEDGEEATSHRFVKIPLVVSHPQGLLTTTPGPLEDFGACEDRHFSKIA